MLASLGLILVMRAAFHPWSLREALSVFRLEIDRLHTSALLRRHESSCNDYAILSSTIPLPRRFDLEESLKTRRNQRLAFHRTHAGTCIFPGNVTGNQRRY